MNRQLIVLRNSKLANLNIAQGAGYVKSPGGPVVVIMSQYVELGTGKTIYSKGQLESFGCKVDDVTSMKDGGKQ